MGKLFAVLSGFCFVACAPSSFVETDDDSGGVVIGAEDTSGQEDNEEEDLEVDADGDGFSTFDDCDDTNPSINPDALEDCENGIDDNCNSVVDTDFECLSECEKAVIGKSYLGCSFHALDLPNFETQKGFGIALANASQTETAEVVISTIAGLEVDRILVPPGQTSTFEDTDREEVIAESGVSAKGYNIESDLPITAYQFNSLTTIGAASTDASLLFANHNLATDYFAMNYESFFETDGFMAVHAIYDNTNVEVIPTSPVDDITTAVLMAGDTLLVQASGIGSDLTGSQVIASEPVSVFGGNLCAQVPLGTPFCDHLEEQIFPRQALGQSYVLSKTSERQSCRAADHVRVMADQDQTSIQFDPPLQTPITLDAGEFIEFPTQESVAIEGDKPFMVGQFIRSSNGDECAHEGDPSFILQVPTDQFRNDYVFLVPDTYDSNFINVAAPPGANVTLDGVSVNLNPAPIGSSSFTVTEVPMQSGSHRLDSDAPVGITVYGYGGPEGNGRVQNVSYGYPGGLNFVPINTIE